MTDNVNHPSHYTSGKIEVIDFIEDQKLDMHTGNAVKYISRAGKKNPDKEIEDLQKAVWYLQRKITKLEAEKPADGGVVTMPTSMRPNVAPGTPLLRDGIKTGFTL